MVGLIITSFILWILGFFTNKFCLYNILLIIPTILFIIRKWGIHVKFGTIAGCEFLFLFFSVMWRLLFHKFVLVRFILSMLIRIIFMAIVLYDDNAYVYITEERKKMK